MYGGVHYDPGTRQRFIEEFAKQQAEPHFVAVEWEKHLFEEFVKWRPWVQDRLQSRWDFLTPEDTRELSLALAWEGDAYCETFPKAHPLWLETGFQQANFKRRYGLELDRFPESFAHGLVERLSNPCVPTMAEWVADVESAPEPKSKTELIDRVWRKTWSEASSEPGGCDRDARWATMICEGVSALRGGWIAVVVGWQHADPTGDSRRLRNCLLSRGFSVNSIRLGP